MGRDIFRIFKPNASEDPVAKRRAQLRRAQQNYRDRKERYTKRLEEELSQSQAREALLLQKYERLSATTNLLAECLSNHGIQLPVDAAIDNNMGEQHNVSTDISGAPTVTTSPLNWSELVASTTTNPQNLYSATPSPATNTSWPLSPTLDTSEDGDIGLRNVNPAAAGMEFVLILESPCRDHLHGQPDKPDDLTCHALTASAQIGFATPTSTTHADAILERLLRLSPEFCSETEVTPAQMWDRICREPQAGQIGLQQLRALAEKLRDSAQCHGFGAVVESHIFEHLLIEAF